MQRSSFIEIFSLVFFVFITPQYGWADGGEVALPPTFGADSGGTPSETPFWQSFDDPVLSALVKRGISGNFDIEAARNRMVQAEAVARQMLAPLLPSVTAEAGYNLTPYNNVGQGLAIDLPPDQMASFPMATGQGDTEIRHSISAVVKASYLVDITGRNYTARQAALQDTAASRADAETQAANLAFLITQVYFDAVAAQKRLALVEEQITTNEALLELVEARLDRGSANALDVLQQRQQLEATKSQLPLVQSLLATSRNQLAVLTGTVSVADLPPIGDRMPELVGEPEVGDPARLLSARPELRAETARLEAAEQRKKSAFRTLLPTLALSGQVGYTGNYIDQYDDGETWSLGALLSVPLYEGGRNHAALDQARAGVASAVNTRRQAALGAVEEVQSALARDRAQRAYYETLLRQQEASKLAFQEARERYLVGLIDYLNVLVTLASHQQLQLSEVQAYHDLVLSRAGLLKALGGDWTKQIATTLAE
jgi:multidrug efflux system outer membrane protein